MAAASGGDLDGAERLADEVLARHADHPGGLQVRAVVAGARGDHRAAARLLRKATRRAPDNAALQLNLATALGRLGQHDKAVAACRAAARAAPGHARPLTYLAGALRDAGRLAEADAAVDQALAIEPAAPMALLWRAEIAVLRGAAERARAALARCLELAPEQPMAHRLSALVAARAGDSETALRHARRAVALGDGDADNHAAELEALRAAGDGPGLARALAAYRRRFGDGRSTAFYTAVLAGWRGDYVTAARGYQEALAADPRDAQALHALADMQLAFNDAAAAERTVERLAAVHVDPEALVALRGRVQLRLERYDEAVALFLRYRDAHPASGRAHCLLADACLDACDWASMGNSLERAAAAVSAEPALETGIGVHGLLAFPLDAAAQYQVSRAYAERVAARPPPCPPGPERPAAPPLRVGYVTGDVREHPSMHLAGHVFGRHDRSQVRPFVYSIGPAADNPWRERLQREADGFRDCYRLDHEATLAAIREDGIHVLVDCMGFTVHSRPALFAARPAAVQVGWMAYAGTIGGDWLDYFVADPVAAPPEVERHFAEALIHMPGCYLPVDDAQPIADVTPVRADYGLPEHGMVYCCFNKPRKLTPALFERWMRVLAAVPGSVLWLLSASAAVQRNLRAAAARADVHPERLVFAGREDKAAHLARHALADLFLDTEFYDAHTTGVDALWAGVPLLTCPGSAFAARVGASLVTAAGLPELVMPDWESYEAEAIALGREPQRLAALRARLADGRADAALFDADGYVRALESALAAAWERQCAGEAPARMRVDGASVRYEE